MEAIESKRRRQNPKNPTKKEEGLGVDIISRLPDHILHHIISRLPEKYVVRTSTLSKKWEHLWSTFPIINLDEVNYMYMGAHACRELFLESMRQTLSKHDMSHLHKLRICTVLNKEQNLEFLVDEVVALAIIGRVQVLDLNFSINYRFINIQDSYHVFPEIIFSHGSSLVGLIVEGCRFKDYDTINLWSLKTLSMCNIHITGKILKKLISGCPFIDSLALKHCRGFKILRVFNSKLKFLIVEGCRVVGFEMEAPDLQSFTFKGVFNREISYFKTTSSCCFDSLNSLDLSYGRFKVEPIRNMFSRFTNLQNMSLSNCTFDRTPKLECKELVSLEIINCSFPEQVQIETPNLQFFHFNCTKDNVQRPFARLGLTDLKTLLLHGHSQIQEEVLRHMVTYMTSLEILEIKSCTGFKHVRIHSFSLQSLIIEKCPDVEYGELVALKLQYFKYVGPMLEFTNVLTTEKLKAELHLRKKTNQHRTNVDSQLRNLSDFLRKLGEVRDIILVSKFAEFTTMPKNISASPPLRVAKNLKAKTNLGKMGYIEHVAGVLHISACRELLCIELESSALMMKFQNCAQKESLYSMSQCTPHDCLREHLIEVKMEKFEGYEEEMALVECLLGKAKFLRSISLSFKRTCSRILRALIIRRINEYARASPTFEMLFS